MAFSRVFDGFFFLFCFVYIKLPSNCSIWVILSALTFNDFKWNWSLKRKTWPTEKKCEWIKKHQQQEHKMLIFPLDRIICILFYIYVYKLAPFGAMLFRTMYTHTAMFHMNAILIWQSSLITQHILYTIHSHSRTINTSTPFKSPHAIWDNKRHIKTSSCWSTIVYPNLYIIVYVFMHILASARVSAATTIPIK